MPQKAPCMTKDKCIVSLQNYSPMKTLLGGQCILMVCLYGMCTRDTGSMQHSY